MSEDEQSHPDNNLSQPETRKSSVFIEKVASNHKKGHRRQESIYTITTAPASVINCHTRRPSGHLRNEIAVQDIEVKEAECGIFSCRPSCMQKCARIKYFVLLMSIILILQQALSYGYINSVITTIEKRFEIPSKLSGVIASSNDVGNVMAVLFVSYLGSQRHVPVWIGVGAVIIGIGSILFTIPHFVGEGHASQTDVNATGNSICHLSVSTDQLASSVKNNISCDDDPLSLIHDVTGPVMLFVLAQLFLGSGASPLFTLGVTYVDDHVKPENSPVYIGLLYSLAALGPILGFLGGAYFLTLNMDFFTRNISLKSTDSRWIGMWWGGFLFGGILSIVMAIPLFTFPKTLSYEKDKIQQSDMKNLGGDEVNMTNGNHEKGTPVLSDSPSSPKNESVNSKVINGDKFNSSNTVYGKHIKDIPHSIWRLLVNPVYIVTSLGACLELIIASGFVVFLPKYLETQFNFTKSQANIISGSVAVPGACVGIFTGGYILKRMELRPKGALQFILISDMICLISCGFLLFLGCDNLKIVGATVPYLDTSYNEPFEINLSSFCNSGCGCIMNEIQPVCGVNGLTYFSPCHAGCSSFHSNYTNCLCIEFNLSDIHSFEEAAGRTARAGYCKTKCGYVYSFLILLFFIAFIVATAQMPILMVVMRSVSEEERSFALGMQFVIFRIFGYIPAPIVFGNLIDSSCLLWKSSCGRKSRCLLYDNEKYRYRFGGLCFGIKVIALCVFLIDWWLVKRRKQLHGERILALHDDTGSCSSTLQELPQKLDS